MPDSVPQTNKPDNAADKPEANFETLTRSAMELGASGARVISAGEIVAEDYLAGFCREPQCPNFGLSPSCPPNVSGPDGFRRMVKTVPYAIVVKIDLPSSVLFSDQRHEFVRLLHEIVAKTEQKAVGMGFANSKAFAGGSCKQLFCDDETDCRVLANNGKCRHPHKARPSMSGFGVNVSEMMKSAGWPCEINVKKPEPGADPMSWIAGVVLVG